MVHVCRSPILLYNHLARNFLYDESEGIREAGDLDLNRPRRSLEKRQRHGYFERFSV